MENLNTEILANIPMGLPSIEEQKAIVDFLQDETQHIAESSQVIHSQIKKLHDYRQALISAAVTGKIDVSGVSV